MSISMATAGVEAVLDELADEGVAVELGDEVAEGRLGGVSGDRGVST